MTEPETPTHTAGILTDAEAEALTDPETDPDELTDLRARVRDRLTETLLDLSVLYPTLPPEDFDTLFRPINPVDQSAVRAATQDGLALLILGMLHGDDMVEMRLRDAIMNAGVSYAEDIDVTLELRRGPLPTTEEFAAHVDEDGLTEQTLPLFEHFLTQADADLRMLDAIIPDLQTDITEEEKTEIQAVMAPFARCLQTVITGVAVTDQSDDK